MYIHKKHYLCIAIWKTTHNIMKKIFTFFVAALMAGSMNAQTLTFGEGSTGDQTYGEGDFTMTVAGWNGSHNATSGRYFGTAEDNKKSVGMIASGSGSIGSESRTCTFTSTYSGTLELYVCSGSSDAERHITVGDVTKDTKKEYDEANKRDFYNVISFDIKYGTTELKSNGGIYLYKVVFTSNGETAPVVSDSIFYNFEAYSVDTVWTDSLFSNGVHVYSAEETDSKNLMRIHSVKRSYESLSFTKALYFAGSPKSNGRIATVDVQYPATVTVYAMSYTKEAKVTRSLYLSAGSLSDKTAVIAHTTDGTADSQVIQVGTYDCAQAATLYFSVDGGMYLFGFSVVKKAASETPTAIDNTPATHKAVKAIENGQLIIIRDGVKYNVQGQIVK